LQKRFTNLILVLALSSASAEATMAETQHTPPVMGVSSAWTGGDLNNHNMVIPKVIHRAAVAVAPERTFLQSQNKSLLTSEQLNCEKAASAAQTKPEPVLFSNKSMEQVLDSWQLSIKHFIADANPRVTAFIKMASAKLGFPRAGSTKSQMACPPPAEIRMHLQPLSNRHSAWLMSDGRLKTVTAH
jgi:hypothetical protein